jgi:hypothetical protein
MARGYAQSRSELTGNLPVGRYENTQSLKNLFPATRIPKAEKDKASDEAALSIVKRSSPYIGRGRDRAEAESQQNDYAKRLAKAMVNGDDSNGVEEYFPKSMSTQFINALAKSNYAPGPFDRDTLDAVSKIIDLRVADNLGKQDFSGDFSIRSVQDDDGFRLELYTSEYRGRGADGEKQYRSSGAKEIAFIPHDEVSGRITKTKVANYPTEMFESKAFLKAKALDGYLDALLMTSGF